MPKLTLTFKGRLIDVFHIKEGETFIGRDPDCEIAIDSLAISPVNARIKLEDNTCHLQNMDEGFPTLINHKSQASADLCHGDVIQVGKHTLSFAEDALELGGEILKKDLKTESVSDDSETIDEETSKGILQIMNGDKFGRIIPLSRNMTRIGRTGGNCAMIARRDSGYYISYLEGPAPPLVNKTPLGDETQLLADGDIIEVGSTQMQFHT